MAAVFDTLEVLIEADSSGLETQLKRAGNKIASFVDEINSNEINWQSIFTKSLGPALITGIAATVALAISKALQLQESASNAASQLGQTTQDAKGQITDFATTLSGQGVASAQDIASAMVTLTKILGNTAQAQLVAAQAQKYATATGLDFNDVAKDFATVLSSWNISTLDDTSTALDRLTSEFAKSSFTSLDDFTQTLSDLGIKLQGTGSSLDEWSASLSVLSTQAPTNLSGVSSSLNTLAEAVGKTSQNGIALNMFFGDMSQKVQQSGVLGALEQISDKTKGLGIAAVGTLSALGFSSDAIVLLQKTSHTAFEQLQTDFDSHMKNVQTIDGLYQQNSSAVDKLIGLYHELQAALAKLATDTDFLDWLSGIVDLATKLLGIIGDLIKNVGLVTDGIASLTGSSLAQWFDSVIPGGADLRKLLQPAVIQQQQNSALQNALQSEDSTKKFVSDTLSGDANSLGKQFSSSELSNIVNQATNNADLQLLAESLIKGLQGGQTLNFANNFNINAPEGGGTVTADTIVNKLLQQFHKS